MCASGTRKLIYHNLILEWINRAARLEIVIANETKKNFLFSLDGIVDTISHANKYDKNLTSLHDTCKTSMEDIFRIEVRRKNFRWDKNQIILLCKWKYLN